MNTICIDIGNTATKVGVFKNSQLINSYINISDADVLKICNNNIDYQIITSNVTTNFKHIYNLIENKSRFTELTTALKLPIDIKYKTPHTLGSDRIAAVIGASVVVPNKSLLVIQAGTCFTYDFIDNNLNYWGGAISPGLQMRFNSLNYYTSKLPLVEMNTNFNELIGNSTETSILAGVINGSVAELEGIIDNYTQKYPDIQVILTGGWSIYFESKINRAKFAFQDLVLIGLNKILIHNNG